MRTGRGKESAVPGRVVTGFLCV